MTLVLDLRDEARQLSYVHMTVPVRPGPFTLVYPKWIPGTHQTSGQLAAITMLTVRANGRRLAWRRDPVDMYAFHVDVPAGTWRLAVDFTAIQSAATFALALVEWNRDVLYQAETDSHNVFVRPSVILPRGWQCATALPVERSANGRIDFGLVDLATLVDSPLDAGTHLRRIQLGSQGGAHAELDVFADHPQDLDYSAHVRAAYEDIGTQTFALYRSHHFGGYHGLLALSDAIGLGGLEHHQSSDDRATDDYLTNPQWQLSFGDLVTHEFSHTWNGKYRRPADLTTPNFQVPMRTDLLWVYEGLNQYLGDLLSFRSGIRKPADYPQFLAMIYAQMDSEPGRATTPLIDTAAGAPYYFGARGSYPSLRRTGQDFYYEGELLWLDVDTIVRRESHGKRSLDDFLRRYAGAPNTGPITVTYTRADIERLLEQTQPYDWHGFFERYVYEVTLHPPSDELARSGWRLVYDATTNPFEAARESTMKSIDHWYSLGLTLAADGTVQDVRKDSAAWSGGLGPGMKITAIDGQTFTPEVLASVIGKSPHAPAPLDVLVEYGKSFRHFALNYRGGVRYPHLRRIHGVPDMLARIMAPLPSVLPAR